MKANSLDHRMRIKSPAALRSWAQRWRKRNFISFRKCNARVKMNEASLAELELFKKKYNSIVKNYKISASNIANLDECSLMTKQGSMYTLDMKGRMNVFLKNNFKKDRVSLILCITKDGQKLNPFIIIKGNFITYFLGQPNGRLKKYYHSLGIVKSHRVFI
jgi:hypothetical protein